MYGWIRSPRRLRFRWSQPLLGAGRDRGDVPGWVMVTVMSAILVVAILGVFEPAIKSAISSAIDNVTSSGN